MPFVKDYDMGAITGGQREESITVDPGNPDHLAGGANERGVGSTQTWYVSTDGGRNWTNGILPNGTLTVSGTSSVNMSDPSLDFGSNHEIYYSALMHGGTGEPCTLFVSESGDDGANWTDPANGIVAAGTTSPSVCQDKEHIVVDRGHSDNVYVAWTPVGGSTATTNNNVVFSRDLGGVGNGFAFSAPVNISTAGGNAGCLNQGADFALTGQRHLRRVHELLLRLRRQRRCHRLGHPLDRPGSELDDTGTGRDARERGLHGCRLPLKVAPLDRRRPGKRPRVRRLRRLRRERHRC